MEDCADATLGDGCCIAAFPSGGGEIREAAEASEHL